MWRRAAFVAGVTPGKPHRVTAGSSLFGCPNSLGLIRGVVVACLLVGAAKIVDAAEAPATVAKSSEATAAVGTGATAAVTQATAAGSSAPVAETRFAVDEHQNLAYYTGPDASETKHTLDLYVPRGKKDFPTLLFIHGGAWVLGDKGNLGMYAALGRMLAEHGIGCAVANYRLSPNVKHPEHIKDVARAFAWLHKNIATYGGRADELFVSGHSAGGHLAALLGTDADYLKAEGLSLADIKGVVAMSGVYRIPGFLFNFIFGSDPVARREASPINQVGPDAPPFLVVYADGDFPSADKMAIEFARALKQQGVPAETLVVGERNHINLVRRAAQPDDPLAKAIVAFVLKPPGK